MASRDAGKTQSGVEGDARFAQEFISAGGEERHAANEHHPAHPHTLLSASDEPATGRSQGGGAERGQLDRMGVPAEQPESVKSLGGVGTRESGDNAAGSGHTANHVGDFHGGLPELRDMGTGRGNVGADEISDVDLTARLLHPLLLESQALPWFDGADGTISQTIEPAFGDIGKNNHVLPGADNFNRSESASTALLRESDVLRQASTNVRSVGNDVALRDQRSMAEESLQSDLLSADLMERLTMSNSGLLDAVGQHAQETDISLSELAELIEVEAAEVEMAEIGFD